MAIASPVAPRRRRRNLFVILLAVLVVVGAGVGLGVGLSGSSSSAPSALKVVAKPGGGHFVVASTGKTFVMRGFDYQPLVHLKGNSYANESFAPTYYRHSQIASITAQWEAEGYNTVRVFLAPSQDGNTSGTGLNAAYMSDLADFVTTAADHQVRTLVTVGELPGAGGFIPAAIPPQFGYLNEDYLDPQFISAEKRYLGDLISDLRSDGAPLSAVMWELKGEQEWYDITAPLSWTSGTVRTANGQTYNMASPASRAAMENDNLIYWANQLTAAIQRDQPGSLVSVGSYPPTVHHRNYTVRVDALFQASSKLSFVDIHAYPNLGSELAQIESFHASGTTKPVIMGEFGAAQSQSLSAGKSTLISWQAASCHLGGLSVSGWLLWTWNSAAQKEFWDALAGGGVLERALAPVNRPNPCAS